MATSADDRRRVVLQEPQRCPSCRTKIVVPDAAGILVKNAILRVSLDTGDASAKCPRCKSWVEVPLRYQT